MAYRHARRSFLRQLSSTALLTLAVGTYAQEATFSQRPNILWITCEDTSTNLGCYGDPDAKTPILDAMAKEGVVYTNAFATAPVCSPARSCIITGVHACSQGTQHLRNLIKKSDRTFAVPFEKADEWSQRPRFTKWNEHGFLGSES